LELGGGEQPQGRRRSFPIRRNDLELSRATVMAARHKAASISSLSPTPSCPRLRMIRVAPHFRASRSRYDLPDGQITTRPSKPLSSPLTKNISLFQKCKSGVGKAISCPQEGRIAIVTDVGCGMQWTRPCARRAQIVADGQVAWSRSPDAGVKPVDDFTGDGGYQARHTGESAKQPLTPLRGECRRVSAYLR